MEKDTPKQDNKQKEPSYLKARGYRHLTGKKSSFSKDEGNLLKKLGASQNIKTIEAITESIAKYNFLPLLKYIKTENKYKKQICGKAKADNRLVFLHKDRKRAERKNEPKKRPIEYPTHRDAVIYAYYSQEILAPMYEHLLAQNKALNESVIGYRRIPISEKQDKNKSTIHFAKEVFDYIQAQGECFVLTFDVKDFFPSLQHAYLKNAILALIKEYAENPRKINENEMDKEEYKKYARLKKKLEIWKPYLENNKLPNDLYKIFEAVTKYSYIMLRDLKRKDGKSGFDEARLAKIRKQGIDAFFENPREMRRYIFENKIVIHKNRKSGIPHGLPISANLANIYMRAFDEKIIESMQEIGEDFLYKRYSDDMIIIFKNADKAEAIKNIFSDKIKEVDLELSHHKTEFFKVLKDNKGYLKTYRELAYKLPEDGEGEVKSEQKDEQPSPNKQKYPITYLGLEMHGEREAKNEQGKRLDVRIKNASIQKFYRRMDMAIRRQVRRAFIKQEKDLNPKIIVFRRKLYRLFSLNGAKRKYRNKMGEKPKDKIVPKIFRRLAYNENLKYFVFKQAKKKDKNNTTHMGNAITFAKRCDYIFWCSEIQGKEGAKLPNVMARQYKRANQLLERRIVYWIERYKP